MIRNGQQSKWPECVRTVPFLFQSRRSNIFLLACCLLLVLSGCGNCSAPSGQGSDADTASPYPVVSHGRIYVKMGTLHIFDQRTGKPAGTYTLGNRGGLIESDPVIANDTIYVNGQLPVPAGSTGRSAFYALRESDGSLLWQTPLDILSDNFPVTDGLVYVYSSGNILSAVQTSNGVTRWHDTHMDIVFMVVAQGILYTGSSDSSISAFNAATGSLLWHQHLGGRWLDGLAANNGTLYASGQAGIFALNGNTGKILWHTTPDRDFTSPVVANGVIYVLATGGTLYALQADNGRILWHLPPPDNSIISFGKVPLVVVGNLVLYTFLGFLACSSSSTNQNGIYIAAVQVSHGHNVWQTWLPGGAMPSLKVADGVAYTISLVNDPQDTDENDLYALQTSNGKQLWHTAIIEK